MNNVQLYRHIRLDKNEVFYIGIGRYNRPFRKKGRNSIWKNITNKTPYYVDIIEKNLSWEKACELEIKLIKKYGRKDLKTGILANMTDGGEGANGVVHSEETKLKMSLSKKGIEPWNKNKKMSTKHKDKLRKNSGMAKKVINTITGEIYNSKAECARKNNINYVTLAQNLNGIRTNNTIFKTLESYE